VNAYARTAEAAGKPREFPPDWVTKTLKDHREGSEKVRKVYEKIVAKEKARTSSPQRESEREPLPLVEIEIQTVPPHERGRKRADFVLRRVDRQIGISQAQINILGVYVDQQPRHVPIPEMLSIAITDELTLYTREYLIAKNRELAAKLKKLNDGAPVLSQTCERGLTTWGNSDIHLRLVSSMPDQPVPAHCKPSVAEKARIYTREIFRRPQTHRKSA
jgi:hypothetical protein